MHNETKRLREEFLVQELFQSSEIKLIYSHSDRIIIGGVASVEAVSVEGGKALGSDMDAASIDRLK